MKAAISRETLKKNGENFSKLFIRKSKLLIFYQNTNIHTLLVKQETLPKLVTCHAHTHFNLFAVTATTGLVSVLSVSFSFLLFSRIPFLYLCSSRTTVYMFLTSVASLTIRTTMLSTTIDMPSSLSQHVSYIEFSALQFSFSSTHLNPI